MFGEKNRGESTFDEFVDKPDTTVSEESAELKTRQMEKLKKDCEKQKRYEKLMYIGEKIKIAVLGFVFGVIFVFGLVAVLGIVFKYGWNRVVVNMFNVKEITLFQAMIISFTADAIKNKYQWADNPEKSKEMNVVSNTSLLLFSLFLYGPLLFKYSWNVIVPSILNINLQALTYWDSFWLLLVIKIFTARSIPKKEDKKEKKNFFN